jgi:hypothetical protein
MYKDKECDVISVETDWDWTYHNGDRVRMPCDTWFLISVDGSIFWVNKYECSGIE